MNIHVKTIEQAQALPEIDSGIFEYRDEIDPITHHTVRRQKTRSFSPIGVDGDDIFIFTDKDGRQMRVVGTESGPAKTVLDL